VEVVESASDDELVKEDAMILAALFSLIAIILLCKILINLTIYALPLYVAMAIGYWAHTSDFGMIAIAVITSTAAMATLLLLHVAIASVQSPAIRAILGLAFAAPAAFAAYHAVHGIAAATLPPTSWTAPYGYLGAIIAGCVAWSRIGEFGGGHSHR